MLYECMDITKFNALQILALILGLLFVCVGMSLIAYLILETIKDDFEDWRKLK